MGEGWCTHLGTPPRVFSPTSVRFSFTAGDSGCTLGYGFLGAWVRRSNWGRWGGGIFPLSVSVSVDDFTSSLDSAGVQNRIRGRRALRSLFSQSK